MPGEIGKSAAEELKGKLEVDEQAKLSSESSDVYDAELYTHLQEKLQPEVQAFNDEAEAADQLKMEKGSGTLQFFRDNKPAFAVLVKDRALHFLDVGKSTPTQTLQVVGGPEEYAYQSTSAASITEEDLLKGLIRLAAGAKFQAE